LSDGPLTLARDGLHVAIRLSPGAGADRLLGIAASAEGRRVLKISVTPPPENGRANEALLQLLVRAWRLPRRDLSIIAGSTSRNKAVRIAGNPGQLIEKIAAAIARLPGL
jgi:uncharacterized protein (TIGR00251 family)